MPGCACSTTRSAAPLNGNLATGPLTDLDVDGGGGIAGGSGVSVSYAQSADNGYAEKRQLQYAFMLTRAGVPVIYTDGYHLEGGSGSSFPAIANSNYLSQFGDGRLPNLLYIHNQFSRGSQISKWSDQNVLAYERHDKRENSSMSDPDGTTMLFMMNCDSSSGEGGRAITTTFPAGSYLYQYAAGSADNGDTMTNFYYTVPSNQQVSDLIIPKDGYFALSWRTPEMPGINPSTPAISVLQNGAAPATLTYVRKDGPDGDPAFNPYGLPDANATDHAYSYTVPRITDGTNLSFLARADGSAENILMELDGGININLQMGLGPQSGDPHDNPPGLSTDVFLGYEQMQFVQRTCEKFAAEDTSRNGIGSIGAETCQATIGTAKILVRLRELTSSPMVAADTSTAAANHWTTLVRAVNTAGPAVKMFVAYPTTDGTVVDSNYIMKVWFSKSLANNTTTAALLGRFVIKIASSASGSPTNGRVQGQANYTINYNVTNDYDELAYQLPNLYNGNPHFLHTIDMTYTQAGAPTLESFRLVKAHPVVAIADNIVNPPEYDSDGLPFVITLHDVASPTAAQRSYNIEVQTESTATGVALAFATGPKQFDRDVPAAGQRDRRNRRQHHGDRRRQRDRQRAERDQATFLPFAGDPAVNGTVRASPR